MPKDIEEIVNDQSYESEASAASKSDIFVFLGTFLFLVFTAESVPGWIFGPLYVLIGMFIVSLGISAPFFLLRKKYPSLTLLVDIMSVVIVVGVTYLSYQFLFV